MMNSRLNIPLVIGMLIFIFIMSMCLYPEYFAEVDPYGKERIQYSYQNGESTLIIPPIPPTEEFPFGTDHLGRDLKSLIVYGSKNTIFSALSIAIFRLIIALPLSIGAAYKNKCVNGFIVFFNTMFSAFPMIIAVIVLSKIAILKDVFNNSTYITIFLLSVLGWSKMAHMLKTIIDEILRQDFIEGEIAIGKNKLEIALQNILPHLIPSIIVLFCLETATALLSLAQLGVFGLVFTGGYETATGEIRVPIEFDWSSLLSLSKYFFRSEYSYISIYPAIAFAFSIIGFNTLGEGLRIEFEKENSRVITFIRSIPRFLSPKRLVYEIKNYKKYRRSLIYKISFYCFILFVIFKPDYTSPYGFDENNALITLKALTDDEFKGRLTGFQDVYNNPSNYIADKLKSYGIKAFGDGYIHENKVKEVLNIKYGELIMIDSDNSIEKSLKYREDYMISSDFSYEGILDAEFIEADEYYKKRIINNADYYKDKALVIDKRGIKERDFFSLNNVLSYYVKPKVIIYIDQWERFEYRYKNDIVDKSFEDTAIISLSSEAGDQLLRMGKCKLKILIDVEKKNDVLARSVIGYIPGTDEKMTKDLVIIGSNLDGTGYDKDIIYPSAGRAAGAAISLEVARAMIESGIKFDRDIVFAFWDGNMTYNRGSQAFLHKNLINKDYRVLYIDLMNLGYKDTNKLMLDNSKIFPRSREEQNFIKLLKKNAKKNGIQLVYGNLYSSAAIDFTSTDCQPLLLDSYISDDVAFTIKDNLENIDSQKLRKLGQMLLDTIIDSFGEETTNESIIKNK